MPFLSHSLSPADSAVAARLRAVAAVHGISLDVPERVQPGSSVAAQVRSRIKGTDVVIALLTRNALFLQNVLAEVNLALNEGKPVLLLVEEGVQLGSVPAGVKVVTFNRANPFHAEHELVAFVQALKSDQQALISLAGIALGLVGLGALLGGTSETEKPRAARKSSRRKRPARR